MFPSCQNLFFERIDLNTLWQNLNLRKNVNITDLLDKGVKNLLRLDVIYEMGDIEKKRKVISSIFPEKLSFSESGDRTGRVNEAVNLIYTLGKGFGKNKKGQSS